MLFTEWAGESSGYHSYDSLLRPRKQDNSSANGHDNRKIAETTLEVSSRLRYENGHATGVQGIARDLNGAAAAGGGAVTGAKNGSGGAPGLAGGMAHDFNNILMIVRGYAEILLERLHLADPLHAQAQQIMKAGSRASELTQLGTQGGRCQLFPAHKWKSACETQAAALTGRHNASSLNHFSQQKTKTRERVWDVRRCMESSSAAADTSLSRARSVSAPRCESACLKRKVKRTPARQR
jgi:hypothetical protein